MSGVSSTQSPKAGRASGSDDWEFLSDGASSPTAITSTTHVAQAAAIVFEAKRLTYWNTICQVWQAAGFLSCKTDTSWARIKTAALHTSCELLTQADVVAIADDMLQLAQNADPKLRPYLIHAACELAHSSTQIRDAERLQQELGSSARSIELPYDAESELDQTKLKRLARQILGPEKCGKLEGRRIYIQDLRTVQKILGQQPDSDDRTELERALQQYIEGCNRASIDDLIVPSTRRVSQERVCFADRWEKYIPGNMDSIPPAHDTSYYHPQKLFSDIDACLARHEAILKGEQAPLQTRLARYETALKDLTDKLSSEIDKIRTSQAHVKRLQEDRAALDQQTATADATRQQSETAAQNCLKVSALSPEFSELNKEIHALGLKYQEAESAKAQLEEEIAKLEACKPDQTIRRAQEALPSLLLPFTHLPKNISEATSSATTSTDAAKDTVKELQLEASKLSISMLNFVQKTETEKRSIEQIRARYQAALAPFDQTVNQLLLADSNVRETYNTIQSTLQAYERDLGRLKSEPAQIASRNALHAEQMQALEITKAEQEAEIKTLLQQASTQSSHAESILDALEEVQTSYAAHLHEMETLQKSFSAFEEAVFPKTDWDRYMEKLASLTQSSSDTLGPILSQTGQFLNNVAIAAYHAPWAATANSVLNTLHGWAHWVAKQL